MTDDERKMLTDVHAALFTPVSGHGGSSISLVKMVRDLHGALLEVPAGSDKNAKTLLEKLRAMATAYERGSWAFRMIGWAILTAAAIGGGLQTIKGWFTG